jgi:polar amino acid transport system permease protein
VHTFIFIILPQAIPRIIPALGNYLVSIMKDVPVLSVIAILEILNVARIIGDRTFNYLIPLTMVGIIYLLLTLLASAGIRYLDKRLPKEGIPLK